MTQKTKPSEAGVTPGMRTFLDYWLYGVVKTAGELGTGRVFLRAVQEDSIRKLLENERLSFDGERDPAKVLAIYNRHLDGMGIMHAGDVDLVPHGEGLQVSVGASCMYRGVCTWIHDEGTPPPCLRVVALTEVLRIATRRIYEGRLVRFGLPCEITLKPVQTEASADGS